MSTHRIPLQDVLTGTVLGSRVPDLYPEETMPARTVRAKMYVQKISRTTWGGQVELQVVSRGADNKTWASATPSGTLTLTIRNELALEVFKDPGQEFYVDIYAVPPALQGQEGMGD